MSRGDLPQAGMWGLFLQNSIKVGLERRSTIDGIGFRFSLSKSLFDLDENVVGKFTLLPFLYLASLGYQKTENHERLSFDSPFLFQKVFTPNRPKSSNAIG